MELINEIMFYLTIETISECTYVNTLHLNLMT